MSRYEELALKNRLNAAEKLEVVETFAKHRDVMKVATKLDIPVKLVRRALNNRILVAYAKTLIAASVGAEFYGEGIQVALDITKDDDARPADKLAALRFIESMLDKTVGRALTEEDEEALREQEDLDDEKSYTEILATLSDED